MARKDISKPFGIAILIAIALFVVWRVPLTHWPELYFGIVFGFWLGAIVVAKPNGR
jgi:hypothetical protein